MRKFLLIAITFCALWITACKSKEGDPIVYDCATTTPKYTTEIKPIYDASCATAGCHNATAKAADIDLSTYAASKSFSDADSHAI
jgi:hypothetical protein